MADLMCVKLLYATFLACYFNSVIPGECVPMKPWQPIFVLWDCQKCEPQSNEDWNKLINPENQCERSN